MSQSARRISATCLALAATLVVAGCSQTSGPASGLSDAVRSFADRGGPEDQLTRQAHRWGEAYERDPDDPKTAVAYAESLDALGRTDHAMQILAATVARSPNSPDLMAAHGRLLARNGDAVRAASALQKAEALGATDWRTQSALGAALDQVGRHADAQQRYQRALRQQPNSASILSNYGLSQALAGDLSAAETTLRRASSLPGSDVRVRQNLALVLGLQGKFNEAEQLARQDMSADEAQRNTAYLREMLSQDDRWSQIRENG
ncbi:MAG: tetratricopeptide repeat protein [Pseudomonadota bacterium]